MRARILVLALLVPLSAAANERIDFTEKEPEIIIGHRHTPQVSVIITRKNLDAGYELELRRSFLPEIVGSVERGPF